MQTLFGVIVNFDHPMILHEDIQYFGWVRSELIDLTVRDGLLNHLEIAIGGYNEDSRALYEVPEVRRWVRLVHGHWPDSLFWLTPGSLWIWVLCLNPEMCTRLPDGRNQIALDMNVINEQVAGCAALAEQILKERGMPDDKADSVTDQALENLMNMFQRKKPGQDYRLVHPDTGEICYYMREV